MVGFVQKVEYGRNHRHGNGVKKLSDCQNKGFGWEKRYVSGRENTPFARQVGKTTFQAEGVSLFVSVPAATNTLRIARKFRHKRRGT